MQTLFAGSGDRTHEIQDTLAKANEQGESVIFMEGEYLFSDTLYFGSGIRYVDMTLAEMVFNANDEGKSAIIIDGNKKYRTFRGINVRRLLWSNWENEADAGIEVVNLANCNLDINYVRGFTTGVKCIAKPEGRNQGFAYNKISLNELAFNKVGLLLTNAEDKGGTGYINENAFYGGRLSGSTLDIHKDKARCGVRIATNEKASNKRPNSNKFYGQCFELQHDKGYAIGISFEYEANQNVFRDIRDESNTLIADFEDATFDNYVGVSYGIGKYVDSSIHEGSNIVETTRNGALQKQWLIYQSPIRESKASVIIDTIAQKRFNITCNADKGVRFGFTCYDESGNKYDADCLWSISPARGLMKRDGMFITGGDSNSMAIMVDDSVKAVDFGVINRGAKVSSFAVFGYGDYNSVPIISEG